MKIKNRERWFAAGPEVERALEILSDGAFRLYFHLCIRADRRTGRQTVNHHDMAGILQRSRRSVVNYFQELREKNVCQVLPGVNQHQHSRVELCDEFWPYEKEQPSESSDLESYLEKIRGFLSARACVKKVFAASDRRTATVLFESRVPIEQVENAILLGCARKCASLLNAEADGKITSLSYFRDVIDEVGSTELMPGYWKHLRETLGRLETRWISRQGLKIGSAEFAEAEAKNGEFGRS